MKYVNKDTGRVLERPAGPDEWLERLPALWERVEDDEPMTTDEGIDD